MGGGEAETVYRGFPCKDGRPTYLCETGEPYIEFGSGGELGEVEKLRWFPTEEAAWGSFAAAFDEYAAGRGGMLYWRRRPQCKGCPGRGYTVYAVFLISEKPVLTEWELDLLLKPPWPDK